MSNSRVTIFVSSSLEIVSLNFKNLTIVEGVGKTSLITTIVKDIFPKEVPQVLESAVTISPELYLLPNNNATVLVDAPLDD